MGADFSGVRAVYFDLDDTLCAYWDAVREGLRHTFDALPLPGRSTPEMVGHWAEAFSRFSGEIKSSEWYPRYLKSGEPTRTEQMRLTLLRAGVDDPALARELGDLYAAERDRALRLFPEAWDVLEALDGKFPLGLITNGPADVQRQEIRTLGIHRFFDHVFIEGEVGEGKPLPTVMRRAEAAMGVGPAEILFVGNSYAHDVAPAVAAGWRTVWVRRPSDVALGSETGRPEERPVHGPAPDAEIGDLRELLPMLGVTAT